MSDLEQLAADVVALSPADRLRLAAVLLDAGGRERMAHAIVASVLMGLGTTLALRALDRREGR